MWAQRLWGGAAGASILCADHFGDSWHLLDDFTSTDAVVHGGGNIAGVCTGDWCTDIAWSSVKLILTASACSNLSAADTQYAEGLGTDAMCFFWSAGQCDCGNLDNCWALPLSIGILCTDL